ncbi:MAG TPA: hypothetical protein VLZ75_13010 [Chitinophagales bacterium]|nr:hypothetical protein [Chitinophagales bacterium]
MRAQETPTFVNDQYFILKKKNVSSHLKEIENIIQKDTSFNNQYEKIRIAEDQVHGLIKKINYASFEEVNDNF